MRALLRGANGSTVVKLRAFVAGSGDLRRVQEIAGEVFGDRKLPLPALAVVQVGALPLEGAQVSIEATLESRREENPNGLVFIAAQPGDSVPAALNQVTAVLRDAGGSPADVLRATCFVSMLDPAQPPPTFGPAHVVVVQMQREPTRPNAACEAVARLEKTPAEPVHILRNQAGVAEAALVSAPRLVLSGIQLGFGKEDRDIDDALDRIEKGLATANATLSQAVFLHAYTMSRSLAEPLDAGLRRRTVNARPFTILPFEGLSSIDAVLGVDVIAAGND
jgi:enamine deaminase RidA (YjgF/YER057c/UK114 family)